MNVYGELLRAQIENRTADPSLAAGQAGRLWMRTDTTPIAFKVDLGGSAETLALLAAAQTLTNKTIDSDSNTISNIVNANIKTTAAIVRSKLAAGSNNHVLINDGTGVMTSEAVLAYSRGGTAQSSWTAGDLLYASGANTLAKLAVGTSGQVLKSNGTVPGWGASGATLATGAKTTTYSILNTDDALTADSSGASFTMTLPDCATNPGKVFYIKKISSDLNVVTISKAGSDTIQGSGSAASTTTINTQGESIMIASFGGTVWQILNRIIPSAWSSSLTFTPASNAFGTISASSFFSRRVGDSLEVIGYWVNGTAANNPGKIALPSGVVIDTAKTQAAKKQQLGTWMQLTASGTPATPAVKPIFMDSADTGNVCLADSAASVLFYDGNQVANSSDGISVHFIVPVSGWNG